MRPEFPFNVKRPWGEFRQFTENSPSTVKIIDVNPNETLSLQSHGKRSEFWHVIYGSGVFEIGDQKIDVKAMDEYIIPMGIKHRISAGKDGIKVLEIATGEFDEEDIIRFDDKYGRIS